MFIIVSLVISFFAFSGYDCSEEHFSCAGEDCYENYRNCEEVEAEIYAEEIQAIEAAEGTGEAEEELTLLTPPAIIEHDIISNE